MLVPDTERVPISGTLVRRLMARGDGWQELVPDAVTGYIIENGLDERFRQQFGLETLAMELREG
jgi:nicotinic acid mononucleotide adenylyltransferase